MENYIYKTPKDFDPYKDFTDLQHFIFNDKYACYLPELGRRETWEEACIRATEALRLLSKNKLHNAEYQEIFEAIYTQKVSPSMRLFSMPLAAIERDNSTIFNCSFLGIDCIASIVEILYLSMSGVGVGFSLEHMYIDTLDAVPHTKRTWDNERHYTVEDTQAGWAESLRWLLVSLYLGYDAVFDFSQIRPAGSILKTKNGIASGPQVLIDLHDHIRAIFAQAAGRQLTSLELLDVCTAIADCAVSGGSRRSALICIFDPDDKDILAAKSNGFYNTHPWRMNSNNSIAIGDETSIEDINNALNMLFEQGTGEPGLFSKIAAMNNKPVDRDLDDFIGPNPCGEIILKYRPYELYGDSSGGEFCNLSTIIVRAEDDEDDLVYKARVASMIGTIQSAADNFPYLRDGWVINQDEERLLGVCLSGICDSELVRDEYMLAILKQEVIDTNREYAIKLDINPSAASTSVKPSGNSSLLYNMSPGINPVLGKHMIRTVVVNKNSSMFAFLYGNGVPHIDHYSRSGDALFSFPNPAPENSLVLEDMSAIDQLELWKLVYTNYTEHNVSISVTYKTHEIEDVKNWVRDNIELVNGIALFPAFDADQPYLPIRVVNESIYNDFVSEFPKLNWANFYLYEFGVNEQNAVAECAGGRCDIN